MRALAWSASGQIAGQVIRFAFGIALARLLSPHAFGLVAMVTVLTQFVGSIADIGLEEALVQRRELDEVQRSSVFWTMLLAGCVLAVGTFLAAPWIATFYGAAELRPLAEMLSAVFALHALGTVPRALVARRLDFRRSAQVECIAATVAGLCAITLARKGFGTVGLAAQILVGEAVESLLLLWASGWRPRFRLEPAAIGDLLGFGLYRVATRLLGYWSQHADDLLVGKLLGAGPLGLYSRAFNLMRLPVLYVSRAIARVTFPSLSLIQDDPERVRRVFLRTTGAVALVTVPLCMGLFACAESFVVGVLGPQWREAAPLLRVLSVGGLLQSITTLTSSLYLSQGRPDLHLRLNVLQNFSTIAAVVIGIHWGVQGVALGYVAATALSAAPTLYFAGDLVGLRLASVLSHTRTVFLAGAVMTVAVLGVGAYAQPHLSALALFGVQVLAGALVYGVSIGILRARPLLDVLDALHRPRSADAP